jgi:hypothetical protein
MLGWWEPMTDSPMKTGRMPRRWKMLISPELNIAAFFWRAVKDCDW